MDIAEEIALQSVSGHQCDNAEEPETFPETKARYKGIKGLDGEM